MLWAFWRDFPYYKPTIWGDRSWLLQISPPSTVTSAIGHHMHKAVYNLAPEGKPFKINRAEDVTSLAPSKMGVRIWLYREKVDKVILKPLKMVYLSGKHLMKPNWIEDTRPNLRGSGGFNPIGSPSPRNRGENTKSLKPTPMLDIQITSW